MCPLGERGIRTFEDGHAQHARSLGRAPCLRERTHLSDPRRPFRIGVWRAPLDPPARPRAGEVVGADGIIDEVLPNPAEAKPDADQAPARSQDFEEIVGEFGDPGFRGVVVTRYRHARGAAGKRRVRWGRRGSRGLPHDAAGLCNARRGSRMLPWAFATLAEGRMPVALTLRGVLHAPVGSPATLAEGSCISRGPLQRLQGSSPVGLCSACRGPADVAITAPRTSMLRRHLPRELRRRPRPSACG